MLAQREHDYFAETVICANCYIVALVFVFLRLFFVFSQLFPVTSHIFVISVISCRLLAQSY